MLQISPDKIAHIIIRAREYESGINAWAHEGERRQHGTRTELHDFIENLNEDEQASLVAVMWIGRESFEPEELAEAIATARVERTTPTQNYLMGEPRLADLLESEMDALGISPEDAEDALQKPV
jgi:succinyl-CoA synthetase alpha subunit